MSVQLFHGRYQDTCMDVTCDLFCTDAPYSARTHTAYRDQAELRRRPISYKPWTPEDVRECVEFWHPRTRGWFTTLTDTALAPAWADALADTGRYVFSPIACVEPGSRVRQTGDGPAQWSVWLVVARPRTRAFSKWGALPGAYVVPPGHGRTRDKEHRIGGKPLWLMRQIVAHYSRLGDTVADCCMGYGTTLAAALIERRGAVGCEVEHEAYDLAVERIAVLTPSSTPQGAEQGALSFDEGEGPYVCPGCHAIGAEPHPPHCPDAAIEADRERDREYDDESEPYDTELERYPGDPAP